MTIKLTERAKLTDQRCRNAKWRGRKGDRFRLADINSPGLALMLYESGAKSWSYRCSFQGLPRHLILGSYPGLGLGDARKRAAEIDTGIEHGVDPLIARSPVAALDARFEIAFETWLQSLVDKVKPKTLSTRRSILKRHLAPVWRGRLVPSITRTEIGLVVTGIETRMKPTGLAVRKLLPSFFRWAVDSGLYGLGESDRRRNPMLERLASAPKPPARRRAPGFDASGDAVPAETCIVWQAMENLRGEPFGLLPQLLWLTGQRRSEVADLPYDAEYQAGTGRWLVGSARGGTKNGKVHQLTLPPLARRLMAEQIARARAAGWRRTFKVVDVDTGKLESVTLPVLFPEARGIADFKRKLDAEVARLAAERGVVVRHFVMHDLRRSHRSHLGKLGVDNAVAEGVLNHRTGSEVQQVYLVANLNAEKHRALCCFEDHLLAVTGNNVVPFSSRSTG